MPQIAEEILILTTDLSAELKPFTKKLAKKGIIVYDPTEYAKQAYINYLNAYANKQGITLFLGMNPGPWGMAQTGVPFGAISMVRKLGIELGLIEKPANEHPARPVLGWDCERDEVSGMRLWSLLLELYAQKAKKLQNHISILNYCPLLFIETSNNRCRNIPVDKVPYKKEIEKICKKFLVQAIEVLRPRSVIGVGGWVTNQVTTIIDTNEIRIGQILHPSPASPLANKNFTGLAKKQLAEMGIPT